MLEVENRTALPWPRYDFTLNSLTLDMMHTDFELITCLLGRPATLHVAGLAGRAGCGSAATILFDYPEATA
jgi:hypothetical protein